MEVFPLKENVLEKCLAISYFEVIDRQLALADLPFLLSVYNKRLMRPFSSQHYPTDFFFEFVSSLLLLSLNNCCCFGVECFLLNSPHYSAAC